MKKLILLLSFLYAIILRGQPINDSIAYFPEPMINVGNILEKDFYTFSFPFQNWSKDTIKVKRLNSSCSCFAPVWVPPIPPGKWDTIKGILDVKERPGHFTTKLILSFAGDSATYYLTVKGNVQPYPPNKISVSYLPSKDTVKRANGQLYLDQLSKNGNTLLFQNLDTMSIELEMPDYYVEQGVFFYDVANYDKNKAVNSIPSQSRTHRFILKPKMAVCVGLLPYLKELVHSGEILSFRINTDLITIRIIFK